MREQKITLGEVRESGVTSLMVYCAEYKSSRFDRLLAPREGEPASSVGADPTGSVTGSAWRHTGVADRRNSK
jgi:hypothetical protein